MRFSSLSMDDLLADSDTRAAVTAAVIASTAAAAGVPEASVTVLDLVAGSVVALVEVEAPDVATAAAFRQQLADAPDVVFGADAAAAAVLGPAEVTSVHLRAPTLLPPGSVPIAPAAALEDSASAGSRGNSGPPLVLLIAIGGSFAAAALVGLGMFTYMRRKMARPVSPATVARLAKEAWLDAPPAVMVQPRRAPTYDRVTSFGAAAV